MKRIYRQAQMLGLVALLVVMQPGCAKVTGQREKPVDVAGSSDGGAAWSDSLQKALVEFNRGAALLEQYKYTDAAKSFEAVLETAPDWTAARFNLGLAYFNMQVDPGAVSFLELARQAFEQVLESDANHLPARFCLGLYHQHLGDNEKALECFESVARADDEDPYALYKYAEALISHDQAEAGTEALEKAISIDPGFVSAVYRLAIQYQRSGQREKAMALFNRFKELKSAELTGGTFTVLKSYGSVGKYYMALGADSLPLTTAELPAGPRLLFSPELKHLNLETSAWQHATGRVSLPGLAAGDVDGDGDIDLCITSIGSQAATSLWLNDGAGVFSHSAALVEKGISPCFGDVDNDGDLDLWIGCAGEDVYLQNHGDGRFDKVSLGEVAAGQNVTHCARLLDLDSDGDLDLFAMGYASGDVPWVDVAKPAPGRLYNNNRDGSYADLAEKLGLRLEGSSIAAVVYDDFDGDRDLDLVIFPAGSHGAIGWVNDRVWQYRTVDAETVGLSATDVLAATSGDPDGDGDRDLLVFTRRGLRLFLNRGGFRFMLDESFSDRCGRLGGTSGQFADMDNDGDLDIVVADALRRNGDRGPTILVNDQSRGEFTDVLEIDPGNLLREIGFKNRASCVVADFTGDGRCDIVLAPTTQRPMLVENVTSGGHWLEIDLAGMRTQDSKSRSNNSAIGARVDVKTGTLSQQHFVGAASGQLAMPPHRIHVGLGPYSKVDWLRIMWPDAVLQAELELPADQVIQISELQRKTSSCPHLFAWDGTHFEFVSDFGGMGGIGYLLSPGVYAQPDPTEYLPVPNIKPLDGQYVLQVIEPIEEVVYFDEAKLIAVDHPRGTQVYPNEMMAINADPPAFELLCIKDAITPVRATDHRGRDVTEEILEVDRIYAGATEPDHRFIGLAKDHFVELDFGDRLVEIPPRERLVLFASGWVEYGYSSTNFAASQARLCAKAPSIAVFRDGQWVELFNEVGYPAGIRHTMTLELTDKLLPTDRKLRISSNMEIYWDRIFAAPLLSDAGLHVTETPASSADLHFLGYPKEYSPDGRHPLLYDYGSVDRTIPWKMMAGTYTRYGQVTELVGQADDCYVIMGPGEELTLKFPADAFGPVPNGFQRSFVFKSDSYCKDMDLYCAHPETVEPLPFHDMSAYPYPADEEYPTDEKHNQYRQRFNTRRLWLEDQKRQPDM